MANTVMKAYLRSFCDQDVTGYSFTGDFNNIGNINDRKKQTYAITDGFNDDTLTATEELDLKFDRDIDTIVLSGNMKEFNIKKWDGGWVEIYSTTTNTDSFLVLSLSSFTTDKLQVNVIKTMVADEEKQINILEVTQKLTEIELETFSVDKVYERKVFKNIYGGSIQVIKYPNYGKLQLDLSWDNLTGANYTAYKVLKDRMLIDSYIVYLYYTDDYDLLGKEAWHLVNDITEFESTPFTDIFGAGVKGIIKLREV